MFDRPCPTVEPTATPAAVDAICRKNSRKRESARCAMLDKNAHNQRPPSRYTHLPKEAWRAALLLLRCGGRMLLLRVRRVLLLLVLLLPGRRHGVRSTGARRCGTAATRARGARHVCKCRRVWFVASAEESCSDVVVVRWRRARCLLTLWQRCLSVCAKWKWRPAAAPGRAFFRFALVRSPRPPPAGLRYYTTLYYRLFVNRAQHRLPFPCPRKPHRV